MDGSEEESEEPPSELDRQIAANILKRQKKRSRPSPFKVACGIIILTVAMLIFMSTGVFTIDSIQVDGNDYFTGYFSNTKIKDIDDDEIENVFTKKDLQNTTAQLEQSGRQSVHREGEGIQTDSGYSGDSGERTGTDCRSGI